MKKLFTLFLALALLFLTACNTATPPVVTDANCSTVSGNPSSGTNGTEAPVGDNWLDAYRGKVVSASYLNDFIDIPSRIIFEASVEGAGSYGGSMVYNFYYSKADGKAYIYCFDPLCNHMECMAGPANNIYLAWSFYNTFFYNNRFYSLTDWGQMLSFSFDGTDKKIEYDLNYEFPNNSRYSVWSPSGLYGPYLYIDLYMDRGGFERQTLRYNLETKEMENLTEKTGNYINPHYFYNGMIYGDGNYSQTGDAFLKADLDLNTVETLDEPIYMDQAVGSIVIGDVVSERESIYDTPEWLGLRFYDLETGESKMLTAEDIGMENPAIVYATDEYLYFYSRKIVNLGTVTIDRNGKEVQKKVQKMNDGKLYRMNLDGTNVVCVYDNPEYELGDNMVIYDDKVVMQGRYVAIENNEEKRWGGLIQVATINPDGTFGEFVEVEVLR